MTPEDAVCAVLSTRRLPERFEMTSAAVALVRFHHLDGLAIARARESGVAPALGLAHPDLEAEYRRQGFGTALILESVERARSALARAGVPSLVFKGAALVADGTYPDPGARRMNDADVLVPPDQAGRAVRALMDAGYEAVTGWSEDPDRVARLGHPAGPVRPVGHHRDRSPLEDSVRTPPIRRRGGERPSQRDP